MLALVALLLMPEASAAIRKTVSIFGTTVGPGYKRDFGFGRYYNKHLSLLLDFLIEFVRSAMLFCPDSHPWAISNGEKCCSSFEVLGDPLATIPFEAPSSDCQGESIICNRYNREVMCKSNKHCK